MMSITESLAKINIPFYGIVGYPLGFTVFGCHTHTGWYQEVVLELTNPRNPPYPFDENVQKFRIATANRNISQNKVANIFQKRAQPVRNPFVWEGILTLEGTSFHGTVTYYAAPLKMSGFNFKSEELFLSGHSYGPSCDEVIELLEGLQVLNGRDEVIRQYDEPRDL